jgi:4-hydroxy-tetrahydrodipicolinate reductase
MVFQENDARAVILTTTSYLKEVGPQIERCVKAGLNVISTCEELSYPWRRNPDLAGQLDDLAKKHGVTVVGTGINPGFLMDTLPVVLTAPCLNVDTIKVTRMMDSSKRRVPFQKKVGTCLTRDAFKEKMEKGIITGHVGLLESMHMIASGLYWSLDEAVELPPVPVFAQSEVETALGRVKEGDVVGLGSVAYGKKNGRNVITLEFVAHAQVNEEYDEIIVEGVPRIHQKIIGGVHGDVGTVAVTINTVPRAVESSPGLKTMKDLPPVSMIP